MTTEATDLLNAGEVVEALGRAWTLTHVGPAVRARFCAWLKGRARGELAIQKRDEVLAGEEYREALASLNEEFAAGSYNWGSPLDPDGMGSAVRAALNQTEGKIRLVQLLLEPTHGTVEPKQVIALLSDNSEGLGEAIRACMGGAPRPPDQKPTATNGQSTAPAPV